MSEAELNSFEGIEIRQNQTDEGLKTFVYVPVPIQDADSFIEEANINLPADWEEGASIAGFLVQLQESKFELIDDLFDNAGSAGDIAKIIGKASQLR